MATEHYTHDSSSSSNSYQEMLTYRQLMHGMEGEPAHIRPAGAGQIVAQTRNPVVTPQCLVTLAATVSKLETARRLKDAEHFPSSDLLADHASGDVVHKLQKGQIVMMRAEGDGFNTNMNADSSMEAVGSLNGLLASQKFCMPGVVQTLSDPSDLMDNQAQAGVAIHGVQTVCNYGPDRINAGDVVMLSPYAALVKLGKDGKHGPRMGPMIVGPAGYSPETVCWAVMSARGHTQFGFVNSNKEMVRVRMGSIPFQDRISKATTPGAVLDVFRTELDDMFNSQMMVAPDHPIRGYMLIWMAYRWSCILNLEGSALAGMTAAQLGMHMRMALMVRLQALQETEELYAKRGEEYATTIPHDGDIEDAYNASVKRSHSNLNGEYIKTLIGTSTVSPAAPVTAESMRKGMTHVGMHEVEMFAQFETRLRDFFGTWMLGRALSSADKGMAFDVFVGKM